MTALTPRDYQVTAVRGVWRELFINGKQSCLLQAPTGAGKTAAGSFLVKQMLQHKGIRTLCLAHRREIVTQTAKRLRDDGLSTGIIMADELYTPDRDIQVGSVDTLDAWVKRNKIDVPDIGCLWIDECRRAMGARYDRIIAGYRERGALIFGTDATPIRTDGVGLGRSFEVMVSTPGIQWMIDHGYLVPVTYRVGIVPDLKGVKLTAGDYNEAQLQNVMKQKLLIGNVVENWLAHAKGRPTLCFATGVEHSQALTEEFLAAGVRAIHVDAHTKDALRDQVASQLVFGAVEVVCNAQIYTEGTDIPWVSCIVIAQPTKSVAKYLQMAGRGMRPCTGKENLMVLDNAGAVHAHGRIEQHREWMLTQGKEMLEKHEAERLKEKVQFLCNVCGTLHTGAICPTCNAIVKFTGAAKDYLPAVLVDMDQGTFNNLMNPKPAPPPKKEASDYSMADKQDWYAQVLGHAQQRGKSKGWCAHTYRDKFGVWPRMMDSVVPRAPGDEVRSFIQHKNIAYAKGRAQEIVS